MRRHAGLGVSRGIGRGNVVFLGPGSRPLVRRILADSEIDSEIDRFGSAVESSRRQLRELSEAPEKDVDHPVSEIFAVQLLILESSFVEKTVAAIREHKINAEWALKRVLGGYAARQGALADNHFRDKYLDIEDVANRLTKELRGTLSTVTIDPNAVVIARELRPSAVIEIAKHNPAGLITEIGGWTSHMSILAREFRLPMVTGIHDPEQLFAAGDRVVVDGDSGEVYLDRSSEQPMDRVYFSRPADAQNLGQISPELKTSDGVSIVIRANAEDPAAYNTAKDYGAHGVGLYRSELLVSDDGLLPNEAAQYASYSQMARSVAPDNVAIRTFDVSCDQLRPDPKDCETNPALGLRAIRAGLRDPALLRTQLRAILRSTADGKVDIILPMISNVEEIRWARKMISSVSAELLEEGIAVIEPRLGIMIEVPSAVLAVDRIVRHVDFLCLGTNDLVQYILAVDRDNDAVAEWYQTLHPAVLAAIRNVLTVAGKRGIPTTACGEMAGSPFYVPVLIGLGARELSINPHSIKAVTTLISGISAAEATALVESLDSCDTSEEAESLLRQHYLDHWSHLFPPGLITSKHR